MDQINYQKQIIREEYGIQAKTNRTSHPIGTRNKMKLIVLFNRKNKNQKNKR